MSQEDQNLQNKPNQLDPALGYLLTILRDIPIISTAPSDPPKYPISFALYDDGTNRRFYVFFNGNWRYVALT